MIGTLPEKGHGIPNGEDDWEEPQPWAEFAANAPWADIYILRHAYMLRCTHKTRKHGLHMWVYVPPVSGAGKFFFAWHVLEEDYGV